MTAFPAAYCGTCDRWLSPQGSMKAAREAARAHEENRRTFEGLHHNAGVYESMEDYREQTGASA